MNWLREAICENKTGRTSSTRIVMLMSSTTLCLCTTFLTFAAFWRVELAAPLTVFGGALAGMSGAGYVAGRAWSGQPKAEEKS